MLVDVKFCSVQQCAHLYKHEFPSSLGLWEGLKILDTAYAVEDYAAAMSKDNAELYEAVNKALEELIADGTVASIVEKYIPAN